MSKFPVDLSKFKKVSSDSKCTTLRSDAGHEFRVAHGALTKAMKKQLEGIKGYYQGAEVEGDSKPTPGGTAGWLPGATAPSMVENAKQEMNAPLASREQVAAAIDDPNSAFAKNYPGELRKAAEYYAKNPEKSKGLDTPAREPAMESEPVAQAAPAVANDYAGMGTGQIAALNKESRGLQGQAMAMGQLGAAQAKQEEAYQQQQQKAMEIYQAENDRLTQDRMRLQEDIANGHVDADRYVNEKMSTGKHIANAIGLILGGMGAGLTGGPNLAFTSLQSSIDRDIDAQKAELGKKQNLLSHNLSQTQNLRQATELTRIQLNDILSSKLKQEAGKTTDQMTQSRLLEIQGKFEGQTAQLQQKYAAQKALMGGAAAAGDEGSFQKRIQYLKMNGHEAMAKDEEEKYIPGVGVAKVKPTNEDKEALSSARASILGLSELQARAKKYGTTIPGTQADSVNKTKVAALQMQLKQAFKLGVLSKTDFDMLDKVVANPGSIFTQRAIAQLEASKQSMAATANSIADKLGIVPFRGAEVAPKSEEIKTVGGIQYKRGPNGEAIRVR